jgi:hypothetical protein
MSGRASIVKWSPYDAAEFVVVGRDVRVFRAALARASRVLRGDDTAARYTAEPASATTATATPAATRGTTGVVQSITLDSMADGYAARCVAWAPPPGLGAAAGKALAIGDATGRVVLARVPFRFRPDRTLVLAAACAKRPCTHIAWNTADPSALAVGFDRLKVGASCSLSPPCTLLVFPSPRHAVLRLA